MKVLATLLLSLMLSSVAAAQTTTTYTTNQNGCGGKNIGFCIVPVTSVPANDVQFVWFDNRGGGGRFLLLHTDGSYQQFVGSYQGFVANPDGSRNPYYGVGSYTGVETLDSTDGLLDLVVTNSNLPFYAYYSGTCSGRGCGGTIGWHYVILAGSTVEVQ